MYPNRTTTDNFMNLVLANMALFLQECANPAQKHDISLYFSKTYDNSFTTNATKWKKIEDAVNSVGYDLYTEIITKDGTRYGPFDEPELDIDMYFPKKFENNVAKLFPPSLTSLLSYLKDVKDGIYKMVDVVEPGIAQLYSRRHVFLRRLENNALVLDNISNVLDLFDLEMIFVFRKRGVKKNIEKRRFGFRFENTPSQLEIKLSKENDKKC